MKKLAIISCVLMLIINCCTQKKEKAEIVVGKYYDKDYICHVQKQNVPTSIYFSFSYGRKNTPCIGFLSRDEFEYWTRKKRVFRNVKIPHGEETLHQLDLCLKHAANLYPIKNIKYIFGDTFVFADYALLDAEKIDYHSFDYYVDYCHAVDHTLCNTPLYEKMNKLLYKYGLTIDTIKAENEGRKYYVASRKEIKDKCNINKATFIPDSVLVTPITIYIKQRKGMP